MFWMHCEILSAFHRRMGILYYLAAEELITKFWSKGQWEEGSGA